MQKRLVRVGNSVALLLDRSMRQLLALAPDRLVDIKTDGRRLIIEAVDASEPRARARTAAPGSADGERDPSRLSLAEVLDAPEVFARLAGRYGMSDEQFKLLEPTIWPIGKYVLLVSGRDPTTYEGEGRPASLRMTVRRLQLCLQRLESGGAWPDAIAEAQRAVPRPPDA
jgi:hypothetical protein